MAECTPCAVVPHMNEQRKMAHKDENHTTYMRDDATSRRGSHSTHTWSDNFSTNSEPEAAAEGKPAACSHAG